MMTRCKADTDFGEMCDNRVRMTVDRDAESKRVRIADDVWTSHPYTHMYPSVRCTSGLCDYHYNMARFKKLKPGRQS